AWTLKREREEVQHREEQRLDPRTIQRVPYRTGTTYIDDRYAHIYISEVPASFAKPSGAKPRRLTPNATFANFGAPQWSMDGMVVFTTYARDPDNGELFRYVDMVRLRPEVRATDLDRWVVADHSCYTPLPSPDGRWVAFEKTYDDPAAYQPSTLAVRSLETDQVIDLTESLDRTIGEYRWSPNGRYLYFTLNDRGDTQLWRACLPEDGAPQARLEQLTDATHEITSFDPLPDGRVVFAASTPGDPSALYLLGTEGQILPLDQPNAEFLAQHVVGEVEALEYSSDQFTIQGWLWKPAEFDPSRRYPLVVQMHGGPHVMWGASTRSMWHEVQAMLSAGYLVFYCNPRGSDGYGRAFWHANRADWGNGPMRDVLRGVDAICQRPYVDTQRLYLTGGSYAGYLTVWIIGHDHRFAAACAQRGVYNLLSMRNTTDVPFFNDREAGGVTPWDDPQRLWAMSPIALAPNIRTPLLIEHSEQDFRVPIEQAEQLFQALRLMRKPVEFVRWPREGHDLSRTGEPKHRVERIQRILQWFNTYTRPPDVQE
ncbi:MAG: S9 family peptidase, partial [Anaerolineae bacterium]|nr:S9 family peptidase [Thermoflexales bacterium]MDW8396005.1 S9 family peptidase [Anaerolineae bacterium]